MVMGYLIASQCDYVFCVFVFTTSIIPNPVELSPAKATNVMFGKLTPIGVIVWAGINSLGDISGYPANDPTLK